MNEKRFEIDTPIGKLVAEAGGDYKDYPGIYIYLQREDGVQIDLSCTEIDKNWRRQSLYLGKYVYG